MEISFRSVSDIQIVSIKGALGETEAAAVRFKLEEKVNQGRHKIVFDLTAYEIANDAARMFVLGLFQYTLARGALTVCSGVPAAHWPLLLIPGDSQVKPFISLNEALDYAAKNEPTAIKDYLKEKLAGKKDEELKEEALKKLLEKYAVFQQTDHDDPLRLEFLARQYRTAPSREILSAERKANELVMATQNEIVILDRECDELAARLKSMVQYRKSPLTARELEIKQEALTKEIREAELVITKISGDVAQRSKEFETMRTSLAGELKNLEKTRIELPAKLKATQENFRIEAENLKKIDEREEAELAEKMKSLK